MKRARLHRLRPSYRWTLVDVLLLSIPLFGLAGAAIGRFAGWA